MSVVPVSLAEYDDSPGGSEIEFRTLAFLLALSAVDHYHSDDDGVGGEVDIYNDPGSREGDGRD
jgi:hypothetical protein